MYSLRSIHWKALLLSLFLSLGVGLLSGLLVRSNIGQYQVVNRPPLSPPAGIFPVVWVILYLLMGISAYLIYESGLECRKPALIVYGAQLAVNFFWPLMFFHLQAYFFAFLWLILLWALVFLMILLFYRCRRVAAFLQIPYLLWLTFAGYLSYGAWVLNR